MRLLTRGPSQVYVIGGLVDTSVQKRASHAKATELGVQCRRLPLAEHAPVAHGRLPLTLTAVLEILIAVHGGSAWPAAVQSAVAPRLLRPPTYEHSRAARRASSRAAFNARWEHGAHTGAAHAGDDEPGDVRSEEESGEGESPEEEDDQQEEEIGEEDGGCGRKLQSQP